MTQQLCTFSVKPSLLNLVVGLALVAGSFGLAAPQALAETEQQRLDMHEQRMDSHEQRINAIDKKLDKLFDLLTRMAASQGASKVGTKATSTVSQQTARQIKGGTSKLGAIATTQLKPGLILEVYKLKPSEKLPTEPKGFAIGKMVDIAAPVLNYGVFKKNASFLSLANNGQGDWVGLNWTGMIKITDTGDHIFSIDVDAKKQDAPRNCYTQLNLDGEKGARITTGIMSRESQGQFSEQFKRNLSPGLYDVSIWQICNASNKRGESFITSSRYSYLERFKYEKINTTIKMHGPNDWEMQAIPKTSLGYIL